MRYNLGKDAQTAAEDMTETLNGTAYKEVTRGQV